MSDRRLSTRGTVLLLRRTTGSGRGCRGRRGVRGSHGTVRARRHQLHGCRGRSPSLLDVEGERVLDQVPMPGYAVSQLGGDVAHEHLAVGEADEAAISRIAEVED